MEENPAAAVENTTETNQPTTEQTAQNPNTITLTDEQAKFFNANGGMDKMFDRIKQAISNPQPKVKEEEVAPAVEPVKQQVQEPTKTPEGYITAQEYMAQQYFNNLSNQKEYEGIADAIRSGDILKEMAEFNINPTDQYGNINDTMVRKFLNLKAQTVPAQASGLETSSATPTVSYTEVGENILSRDEAMKILSEAGHPRHNDALEFIRKDIWK